SSYRDLDVEHVGQAPKDKKEAALRKVEERDRTLKQLRQELEKASDDLDTINAKIDKKITQELKPFDDAVTKAEMYLKELTASFDRFAKLAAEKRWKAGDTFRD